jgi:hypothetical protein
MGVMRMFMILVWRMVSKVLRRFGRWALLAPVAAIGAALFGRAGRTAQASPARAATQLHGHGELGGRDAARRRPLARPLEGWV